MYGAGNVIIVVDRRGTPASQAFSRRPCRTSVLTWSPAGPVFPIATSNPVCTVMHVATASGSCAVLDGRLDPNFKRPKSLQWNLDLQQAITNHLTIDMAYVANHGYDETYSQDLNAAPVGTAYTPAIINACATVP